jgi:hypothetical protein
MLFIREKYTNPKSTIQEHNYLIIKQLFMSFERKIEFYKDRSIGERFSAAIDFLKQTWRVLLKNVVIIALPLALICAYFMQFYLKLAERIAFNDFSGYIGEAILFALSSFLLNILIYAITGTVLLKYERGELTEKSGWNEIGSTVLSLLKRSVIIGLFLFICVFLFLAVYGFILGASFGTGFPAIVLVFFFLLFLIIIALIPCMTMLYLPAYFSDVTAWESLKISFKLGFKNWGSLFICLILTGFIYFAINVVFAIPYQVFALINPGQINFLSFIFSAISIIGTLLTVPIVIVVYAFQYFSITEKEDGVSLQSKVNEFENL